MNKLLPSLLLFIVLASGLAHAFVNIQDATLGPSGAQTGDTLTGSVTCDGTGTLTAYWNIYKGTTNMTSLAGQANLFNDTEMQIFSIPNTLTLKNEVWGFRAWCVNTEDETTTMLTSNTVVIANTAPIATSAIITPTTGTSETIFTCTGSATDADSGDSLTQGYQFMNGMTVIRPWASLNTYQCTAGSCPVGAGIYCQYRVNDGTANSEIVESSVVIISAPEASISISSVALGSVSQEKNNPREDQSYQVSSTMTVTNTGTKALTDISLTSTADSKYNISFSPSTIASLAPGAQQSVTVRATMHESHDAFDKDSSNPQTDRAFSIGTIQASGNDGATVIQASSSVTMQTRNKLEINRLYVTVDGKQTRVNDGDTVEDVKPGSVIEVRLEARTRFTSTSRVDLRDVEFIIDIDDRDLQVDEEVSIRTLRAGDGVREAIIKFTVEDDVEDAVYTMFITLIGEDSYGAIHGEQYDLRLDVDKEDEEITIRSAILSPDSFQCQRAGTLDIRLRNTGKYDSDEVVMVIQNDALGIFQTIRNIRLDEGDDYSRTIPVSVGDNVPAGTYPVRITTYFDEDAYDDRSVSKFRTVDLIVRACTTTPSDPAPTTPPPSTQEPAEEVIVIVDPGLDTQTPTTPGGSVIARPPSQISTPDNETMIFYLIILGYIVAILIGIWLIIKLFKS